jgi:hypothetical protein
MKFVAYSFGGLQLLLSLFTGLIYGSRPSMSAMQESSVFMLLGFGSVCIALGGVISAIERLKGASHSETL